MRNRKATLGGQDAGKFGQTEKAAGTIRFKFWSDTNFGLFMESLDMRMPSNLWTADPATSQVWFTETPPHTVITMARQMGADVIGV